MRMTVKDVMTTDVASVNEMDTFHVVAELLIGRGVSGLPVVDEDAHVLGVVSEADLLCKAEFKQLYYGDHYRPPLRARLRHRTGSEGDTYRRAEGETAHDLMSSPAIVTTPDSPLVLAARLMDRHGVKRLPVVDADGCLAGILSRRDLVKAFLRSDEEIRRTLFAVIPFRTMWADRDGLDISVRDGVIAITGRTDRRSEANAIVQIAENLDGVVAVHADLTWKDDDIVPATVWDGLS